MDDASRSVRHGAVIVLLLAASAIASWRPLRLDPLIGVHSIDVESNADAKGGGDQERGQGALRVGRHPEAPDVRSHDPTSVDEKVDSKKQVRREITARLPLAHAE